MITGHLGIAAAVRIGWRQTSLLWLLPASIAPDLLDVVLALLGVCNPHGLYSHSVPVAALLGAVLGGAAFLGTRSRTTGLAVAALVLLHLPADMITGSKIFWPGGPLIGLDLYTHPVLDFLLEASIALGGWLLLRRDAAVPRWAVVGIAACALVLVQAAFDGAVLHKPSACENAPSVARLH